MYKRGKRLSDGAMWVQEHSGQWITLKLAAELYSKDMDGVSIKTRE